jgi:hypothetical protein
MREIITRWKKPLGALVWSFAAGCTGDTLPITVELLTPSDGVEVLGTSVQVRLAAEGIEIAPAAELRPGAAHHHLFIDRDVAVWGAAIPAEPGILHLGAGQTEHMVTGLEPGEHRIIAVLGDNLHVPLQPPVADTVRFTVRN